MGIWELEAPWSQQEGLRRRSIVCSMASQPALIHKQMARMRRRDAELRQLLESDADRARPAHTSMPANNNPNADTRREMTAGELNPVQVPMPIRNRGSRTACTAPQSRHDTARLEK